MIKKVIIISGSVGSGKSTLAQRLCSEFGFVHFKTNAPLKEKYTERTGITEHTRNALQDFGDFLDRKTGGKWVCTALDALSRKSDRNLTFVVDSVRIEKQIVHIRKAYGSEVTHVHLDAPTRELSSRYKKRKRSDVTELGSYNSVLENKTEREVPALLEKADIVIDTSLCTVEDVFVKVASRLGLFGKEPSRAVDVLVGGQYGSEGKGNITAYLAPEYDLLLRVGGPNAGHKVFQEPSPETFHMLPSGTRRASRAKLVIGAGAVFNVDSLLTEIGRCDVESNRLVIDPQAMIIARSDAEAEGALVAKIGSTGQGVGVATARRILKRFPGETKLAGDVPELKPYISEAWKVLREAYRSGEKVLLEGTQGTGLSLYHGEYPYVTSRDTTVSGCLAEAGISPLRVRKIIMVCRTYPIRVQSPGKNMISGPMSQEISLAEISRRSGISLVELKKTETTSTTKRRRRIAEFDWVLLQKAVALNSPTDIALTFVDYIDKNNRAARRYEQLSTQTIRFVEDVEAEASAPVSLISTRFHYRNIIDRRTWH